MKNTKLCMISIASTSEASSSTTYAAPVYK
jgi:hypothetical protein